MIRRLLASLRRSPGPATIPLSDAATLGGLTNAEIDGVPEIRNVGTCSLCGGVVMYVASTGMVGCRCMASQIHKPPSSGAAL